MNERAQRYQRSALYFSGGLHLFVIIMLAFSFNIKSSSTPPAAAASLVSIQAVSVNQQSVQQEMSKIKQEQEAKKQEELNHQKELKRSAEKAKQERADEQKQLALLKVESAKLQAQKKQIETDAANRLADIKKQQALAQDQLASFKKQQQAIAAKPKAAPVTPNAPTINHDAENDLLQKINEETQHLASINQQMIQSELAKYKALILNAIGRQWIMPANVNKNLSAQFQINLDATGNVLSIQLIQSSGDAVLDRSVQLAIQKASPLPIPTSPDLLSNFKELRLTVRPEGLMGGAT
jgi:colicin import membrane protein